MYVQLDQFEKGFGYCQKSLELKPEDPVTLQNLKEARQAFQRQKSGK